MKTQTDPEGCPAGTGPSSEDPAVRLFPDECTHQSFYKSIMDSLPMAVVTMDSELRITGFNPWAEKLTGYRAEEAMGRICQEILHSTLCSQNCPLKAVQNPETRSVSSKAEITGRDGGSKPVRISAAALFDAEGRRVGGVEAIMDISSIVAMERLRANFVSMLAHDMRSSLTGIHGLGLRLLRNLPKMPHEKVMNHLEIITREAGKLESLVDDFLELSRIEAGGVKLNITAVSLDKELEELFDTYRERASQRGLRLELQAPEILPVIEADAARLRRVFANLLDNAMKFSGGTGAIVIRARETDQEIVVSVEDEGIGIEPGDLPFIFDIFHRGSATGGQEGHGLGLATVKAIVESHGGRIVVTSEVGAGSTFTVFLPRHFPRSAVGERNRLTR
jgi:two-component system phosphate regulon sensor histidine kinase PhoR